MNRVGGGRGGEGLFWMRVIDTKWRDSLFPAGPRNVTGWTTSCIGGCNLSLSHSLALSKTSSA